MDFWFFVLFLAFAFISLLYAHRLGDCLNDRDAQDKQDKKISCTSC